MSVTRAKNQESNVPKMKTKKAASKRFRKTANGFKRGQSHRRHILTKKPSKRKRQLRREAGVHETDIGRVKAMLPFA
jgi:large subunit ribosomal protein L35